MRSAQMIEEEEETASGAEFNLGMGSLIGIFFGLAMVCGVFFGFGYMMGHRGQGAYVPSEPLYEAPKAAISAVAPKPSAEVATQPSEASRVVVPNPTPSDASPGDISAIGEPAPNGPAPNSEKAASALPKAAPASAPPVAQSEPTSKLTAVAPAPIAPAQSSVSSPSATVPGAGIMVQIAAVKSRPDAEALAAALQKNGFSPTIRTEPQDKFLHVQIGPFASRDEAKAMRQKLSSAGYNAFIK